MLTWIGFSLTLISLLYLSRRSLALGMAVAAIILAVFTLSPNQTASALLTTFTDPSVLLLAFIVGLIPMIGGALEKSGEMDRLVANMHIGKRPFLALAPALLGMLPMPGGALLSAPLIERGAADTPAAVKAAANVWFRHVLYLVYPLGPALIASAKMASLDVYRAILFLIPFFLLDALLGYVFLLRRVNGRVARIGAFSFLGLSVPLAIILTAPALDILINSVLHLPYHEIGTAIGVTVSFLAVVAIGRLNRADCVAIARKMRPWKFSLIILAMFVFLNVFKASGVPETLAALDLSPIILCVVIGFLLGLITGRIQTPASILIPIYISTYGMMSGAAFAVTFFSIFLGYIITPIHPCISVSLEYFGTSLSSFLRRMAGPITVAALITLGVAFFVLR